MDKINVVILAGDRKASLLIENDNKAFLKINNIPCIIYTLKSFLAAETAGKIIIAGPAERLKKTLEEYGINLSRIKIVEQRNSLIENGEAGYIASLDNINRNSAVYPPDDISQGSEKGTAGFSDSIHSGNKKNTADFCESAADTGSAVNYTDISSIDRNKYSEVPVLISSCDIPLITPYEIDEFVKKSDTAEYDYLIGLCSEESLKYYYPSDTSPGMRLNYFHLRKGNFRVNNLCIVKPLKIERLEYIERMYEVRYQTHFFNMMKLLFRILFNGRGVFRALFKALKLHLALYCFDRGYLKLYPKIKEAVSIDKVFSSIGKVLGTRAAYVITEYGGAALDIDHPEDKEVIEKMYDRWMEHQNSLKPEKK